MTTVAERVARLEEQVEGVRGDLVSLKNDLGTKHKENRLSIHALRNGQEGINLRMASIRGWAAGASAVGGIATGLILHFLDKVR